jgi:hypothetical protein
MPAVWRRSIVEALEVIDLLDERLAPLEAELKLIARADPDVALLRTIPGVGGLLAPTISAEIGDISRCSSPRKLVGHAGMAPRASASPASAASPGYRSPRQARECSAGRRSRRPSTPATRPAPGTTSTAAVIRLLADRGFESLPSASSRNHMVMRFLGICVVR